MNVVPQVFIPIIAKFINLLKNTSSFDSSTRTGGGKGKDTAINNSIKQSEALQILSSYIDHNKFREFFDRPDWEKILPGLAANKRLINQIQTANLKAKIFRSNVLVIYKAGKSGEVNKENVLFLVKINKEYKR